jgi:micrococcal nuclease
MITESPAPTCDTRAYPKRQAQMAAARQALRICSRARVTGVAFFDFDHGQTGVAPNAIELHPILGFRCLSGGSSTGPTTTSPTRPTAPAPAGSASHGKVKLLSLTSRVSAGSDATLVVAVPTGTTCSIVVTYESGPSSAAGLYPQRASGGRIDWTWRVGTRTTPGRWPIDVSCGAAGNLHTSFVVT